MRASFWFAVMTRGGADAATERAAPEGDTQYSTPAAGRDSSARKDVEDAPSARKAMAEAGLSRDQVTGTGRDGRVMKEDVARAAKKARPALEQQVEDVTERIPDVIGIRVGDFPGLEVDALAQADIGRAVFHQVDDILPAAVQAGLDYGADPVVLLTQLPVDLKRYVGDAGVLHVDTHETAVLARAFQQRAHCRLAAAHIETQAEFGEFDRDAALQPVIANAVERLTIERERRSDLLLAVDVFAEHVDRARATERVQLGDSLVGIGEVRAGNIATRKPPDQGTWHQRHYADKRFV